MTDEPEDGTVFGLGEPPVASCKAILAQGGGKCWASSVFYLLTGKKSGKRTWGYLQNSTDVREMR